MPMAHSSNSDVDNTYGAYGEIACGENELINSIQEFSSYYCICYGLRV